MAKRLGIFFVGALVFLFFVLFSYLVHKDLLAQFDFDTTVKLQDRISRGVDEPFSYLSLIGSFEPMLIVLLAILVLYKKIRGIFAIALFAALHIFELYGKTYVAHFPPPEFMLRTEKLMEFPQFHVRKEFSYPSGHAGRAMFITTILAFMLIKSKKINQTQKVFILSSLAIYDIVMLVSRVYLGEHWSSDVIGGSILGAALGIISFAFL